MTARAFFRIKSAIRMFSQSFIQILFEIIEGGHLTGRKLIHNARQYYRSTNKSNKRPTQ